MWLTANCKSNPAGRLCYIAHSALRRSFASKRLSLPSLPPLSLSLSECLSRSRGRVCKLSFYLCNCFLGSPMRKPCCEKKEKNKGAWSKQEDLKLIDYIQKHGEGCWRSLPEAAGICLLKQDVHTHASSSSLFSPRVFKSSINGAL